ncbi:DJ-1/PfpI family protein [Pseudochryseolinea flava]|uniref:DJ-1/PfpI family protein n=1 Tax=Pseudochryseolinea flava TaxID=2059302 RepID=A0A364XZU6_9BACT|nr:DJ-1/PfpI family protein [Pseudochryseolinea flava]RAV99008.1 DJ-1/PfpI family protein [Pseudochryseolinea flava]
MKHSVCMLIFPQLTALDFVGPYEVFAKAGCFDLYITSAVTGNIEAEGGLVLEAKYDFQTCPPCDILFVPGGRGITSLLANHHYISFIKKQTANAKYITSVCTGSLLLAVAGTLRGFKATTHWRSLPLLQLLGIETEDARVVVDRNRITGAGVTSGIDFGLQLTALIVGTDVARTTQLMLEYDPQPPFQDGSPKSAAPAITHYVEVKSQELFNARKHIIKTIIDSDIP